MQTFDQHTGNGVFLYPPQYYAGNGISMGNFSNPYYRHNKNGNGIADLFKSAVGFFKDHSGTIANAANAAGGVANVIKTVKDIKRADEELYELKRIRDEIALKKQEQPFTKAQQEIMDKIRRSGNGIGNDMTTGGGIKIL